ncbi:MAG: hypothetical protein IK114_14300 [Fibrobacter sp.]|nr:hypothetical protein [Fibrobacter sp.]
MLNDFDITTIENLISAEVRKLGVSEHVWNNRPKATDDTISDFVVVKVSGGISDKAAYGDCRVLIYLFARDVKEMKNAKRLSVMQQRLRALPLWIEPLLINGKPRVIGDTADDFGFHTRILNFKVFIKSQ